LLKLPIKKHAAEADLADALVTQRDDLFQETNTTQVIKFTVINAVNQLEEGELTLKLRKSL
jgi:hypothetical protein